MKKSLLLGALLLSQAVVFSQYDVNSTVKFKSVKSKTSSNNQKAAVLATCANDTVQYAANKAYYLQEGFNDPNTGGWSINRQAAATNIVTTAYKVPTGGSVTLIGAEVLGIMMLTGFSPITTPTVSTHKLYLYTVNSVNKPLVKIDSAYVDFTEEFDTRSADWIHGPHTLTTDFAVGVKGGATSDPTHFLYVAYNGMNTPVAPTNNYGEHLSFKYQAGAGDFVDMASNFGDATYDFEFAINPILTYNFAVDFTPSVTSTCPSSPVTLTNTTTGSEIFTSHSFSLGAFASRYNVNEGSGAMDLPRDSIFEWRTGINTQVYQNDLTTTSFTTQTLPDTYNDTLYTVALTHNYKYCYQRQIISYTVNPTPTVASITGTASVCGVGVTTNLANVTSNGVWSSATPSVATVSNAGVVTSVSAGTSLINYTVSANGCDGVSSQLVTVTVSTAAPLFTQIDPICQGATAPSLPGQSTDLISGSWSPSAINTATSGSVLYTFTPTAGQCSSIPATMDIVVNALPTVAATTGTLTVCNGTTATLTNSTPNGVWSSTASNVATVNGSGVVAASAAGTTTINYTVTTNGCSSAASSTFVVTALPTVAATTGAAILCNEMTTGTLVNTTPNGVWTSSVPATATVSNAGLVTGVTAGLVNVIYTVTANGCSNSSVFALEIADCAGIEENASSSFSVYPNPSNSIITVNLNSENGTIGFYSIDGKLIEKREFANETSVVFDVKSLTSGIYFFQIGNSTERVIVQ
jgi:hypothetical protein